MKVLGSFLFVFSLVIDDAIAENRSGIKVAAAGLEQLPLAPTPVETFLKNARVFMEYAGRAAEQGAKLIAFPEYGLFGTGDLPPEQNNIVDWFTIYLPDEAVGVWNPCENPERYTGPEDPQNLSKVLEALSCSARNHSIVMMINCLTIKPCPSETSDCDSNGYQSFNTNVFFGTNGTIIAVYHKRHLYDEPYLQAAPEPEYEIVNIDGTDFGSFVCFDLMYEKPAFEYVTKHGIRNVIFTTRWINELPFYTTPQLVGRYARGLGVNVVSANAYDPMGSCLGSGIYSSSLGALVESYDLADSNSLLVAELPTDPLPVPVETFPCDFSAPELDLKVTNSTNYKKYIITNVPSSAHWNNTHKIYYESLQNYTHQFLTNDHDSLTLCVGDLCCRMDYEFSSRNDTIYAFAIANHLRYFNGYPIYMQVCSVLRCESEDIETCGRVPEKPTSAQFRSLNITGSFATSTILPSVTGTDLQSFPYSSWTFSKGECSSDSSKFKFGGKISLSQTNPKASLMVASLYGRVFERD